MKTGGTMMLGSSGILELKNADGRRTTERCRGVEEIGGTEAVCTGIDLN
jgi:hypothetical protein